MGAGPVGLVSALHALHAGHAVHIFSLDDKLNSSTADNWPGELKSGRGLLTAYGEDKDLNVHNLKHLFIESKIRGGFANVWGATWGQFSRLVSPEWQSAYEQVDRYVWSSNPSGRHWAGISFAREFSCTCFEVPAVRIASSGSGVAKIASLALIHHDCDCVASGFSTCEHGSVFDTSTLLGECQKFELFELFESVKVESTVHSKNGVELLPNVNSLVYDKVVLAAGPIANARIIMNSNPNITELVVKDNDMFYVPLVNLFKKKRHPGSFAFSQIQISSPTSSDLEFHQQIYGHPELFVDRITSSVPRRLRGVATKVLKIASGRMNIGIVYLDQRISSKVALRRTIGLRVMQPDKALTALSRLRLHFQIWRNFFAFGFLWFWPIAKKGLPGASFHAGALEGNILDEYGRILDDPSVAVAGSLSLERLEPGPITNTSMAQAIRLLNKMMELPKL